MKDSLDVNCKVCKKPMKVELGEGWRDLAPETLDSWAKSVCCDDCLQRTGYARRMVQPQLISKDIPFEDLPTTPPEGRVAQQSLPATPTRKPYLDDD